MNLGSKEYYEVVALIGFKERFVEQLNRSQDNILEDKDRIHYILINEAMKAKGRKFSRWIIGNYKLVDNMTLAVEIVRLNTPSQLFKDNG